MCWCVDVVDDCVDDCVDVKKVNEVGMVFAKYTEKSWRDDGFSFLSESLFEDGFRTDSKSNISLGRWEDSSSSSNDGNRDRKEYFPVPVSFKNWSLVKAIPSFVFGSRVYVRYGTIRHELLNPREKERKTVKNIPQYTNTNRSYNNEGGKISGISV